jgi:hypothetical protein
MRPSATSAFRVRGNSGAWDGVWQAKPMSQHTCRNLRVATIAYGNHSVWHTCGSIAYGSMQACARSSCSASKDYSVPVPVAWSARTAGKSLLAASPYVSEEPVGRACRTRKRVKWAGTAVAVAPTATPTASAATASRTLKSACGCDEAQGLCLCL